ncbi:hypothetical protein Glove_437g39 [Diversispora epigaea]|uniref:Protein kinase domain-containing protein n=1 Tax=Diversispora epigaea TaxID=1348612 RepID=A0A397GRY5_9GLOM|nr:hypothetical protein Glove_437g39 [Diversispora epigaea]
MLDKTKKAGAALFHPAAQVLVDGGNLIPIVSLVTSLFREIIDLVEKAGHNKKVCRRLAERIRVANQTISESKKEENDLAFQSYVKALKKTKEFIKDISESGSFMKLITSHEIYDQYQDITKDLDDAILQLNLINSIRTLKEINDDKKLFQSEIKTSLNVMEEVMKDIWEQGMNNQQKLLAFENKLEKIHEAVDDVNKGELQNLQSSEHFRINCNQITCCDEPEVKRGAGQIVKKMYIAQTVCQKEINTYSANQKIVDKQVGILTELKNCQNIITFYGTMVRSGKYYIISEWAEEGDLNTYLKNNHNLSWGFKIRIASEIAAGLAFCHVYNILHHDIRSHNILLTDSLVAKISNFSSARKETDASRQIKDIQLRYRWLAPEKLINYTENEYTKQCDIYSFAIVLWELASQESPFANIPSNDDLLKRITEKHERPRLIPGTPSAYEKVMTQGWDQRKIKRPTADNIFKELKNLKSSYPKNPLASSTSTYSSTSTSSMFSSINQSSNISSLAKSNSQSSINPDSPNSLWSGKELSPSKNSPSNNSQILEGTIDSLDISDSTQINLEILQSIPPGYPDVSEAKRLHSSKKYSDAWPIFKLHADNGDPQAEFYVGYYLISGDRGVEKNKELAVEYFRRSASKNIPDAQFRYGVALLNGEGVVKSAENDKIAIENLEKAAKQGNLSAMFNFGDLLINGAHGVTQDLEQGADWLKKAHKKGHPHAYKKLADRYRALNKPVPEEI